MKFLHSSSLWYIVLVSNFYMIVSHPQYHEVYDESDYEDAYEDYETHDVSEGYGTHGGHGGPGGYGGHHQPDPYYPRPHDHGHRPYTRPRPQRPGIGQTLAQSLRCKLNRRARGCKKTKVTDFLKAIF